MIKNKQGATYGGWLEVILFLILFVGIIAIIGVNMNNTYEQDHDLTFGIVTEGTQDDINNLAAVFDNSTNKDGQTSMSSSFGTLILTTTPRMITATTSLIWTFVSGGFINSIVEAMNLGDYSGLIIVILKLLYFLSLGLILLKILTKVVI